MVFRGENINGEKNFHVSYDNPYDQSVINNIYCIYAHIFRDMYFTHSINRDLLQTINNFTLVLAGKQKKLYPVET